MHSFMFGPVLIPQEGEIPDTSGNFNSSAFFSFIIIGDDDAIADVKRGLLLIVYAYFVGRGC